MSMSFGVAVSSLLAALFLGGEHRPGPAGMVSGIHWTFLVLGLMTIVTAFAFSRLSPGDGATISRHKAPL
jgi:NADH:ubiquinone oxidoreductase subunit H